MSQWTDLQSDDIKTLNDILKWLQKLETVLASGVATGIGDPVVSGTADRILYVDNSGNLYGDDQATRDSTTGYTHIGATVAAGLHSHIDISNDLNGLGSKGVAINLLRNSETEIFSLTASRGGGDVDSAGIFYFETAGTQDNFIQVTDVALQGFISDDGGDYVGWTVQDPEGTRIYGKDQTNTNYSLRVLDNNSDDTLLFSVRNDGLVGIGGTAASPARLFFAEDTDNGSNIITIAAPSVIASDKTQTLQDLTGSIALMDAINVGNFRFQNAALDSLLQIVVDDPTATYIRLENTDDVLHFQMTAIAPINGGGATLGTSIDAWNGLYLLKSIDTTAGDSATINTAVGRFRKDTTGTTFTLTNSLITANSIIQLTPANAAIDATATSWTVSAGVGSATITFNAAPTANFDMNFLVIN